MVVSNKFVTKVKILLNKTHTSFFMFCILDFTSYRLKFYKLEILFVLEIKVTKNVEFNQRDWLLRRKR